MNIAYSATRLPSTLRGRTDVNVAFPRAAYTSMQRLRGTAQLSRAGADVHARSSTVPSQPVAESTREYRL